jgi:hypothetical protein
VTDRLERDYFSIHRIDWREAVDEPGGFEFYLPISRWIRLFRETGFTVEGFEEVQSPRGGTELSFAFTADWAHRWPSEHVWKLHKPAT